MRYCIQQKLGSGGMADVFMAVALGPEGFERPSVVKCIRRELATSPQYVRLFLDEAALSARLAHPNIVHVYEFGVMDRNYFIAMERVPGHDLRWALTHLPQRAVVPTPAVAAEIARQCCLALDYAHGLTAPDGTPLNIVHRDVTPANIVVAFDGTVKLLDFGVARTGDPARRSHTDAGVLKGKLAYAAPEQIRSHDVDGRCDLFSLGVVLHELLTWRRLFYAKSDAETLTRVLEHPIPLPSSKNRAVSPALDRIVMKALERDRSLRYQSAGDMADDLERYLLLSRHSGRVMRRLMRNVFEPVWRDHDPPDEADTALEPPESSNRTLDAASCIIEVAEPVTPNSASAPVAIPRRRWPALALAASLAAALLSIGAAARRSLTTAARQTAAMVTPPAPAPSVSVSIDSIPQGALVYADPAAPPVGETPLVVTLVKSRHVVSYTLSKNDYDVAVVKIIPDQDKPVLVQLAAATSRSRTGRAVLRLRAGASLARK